MTWGPRWLRASFFPFFLLFLCVPISAVADSITVPLRLLATTITSFICHVVLGINVIQEGNRLFDSNGTYQYEVAAACSGIRSLTAIFALTTIYGFTAFRSIWRTGVVIASAFPLALAANVLRLVCIIIASEVFSPAAGRYIHESSWSSMLPYIPAMIAMLVLGHWLRENRSPAQPAPTGIATAAQNS
jgi:exosortase